jgi:hypothetical protein
MSRVSKAVRKIRVYPIVTQMVEMAEVLLGAGTGSIKRRMVMEVVKVILARAKDAGVKVPENNVDVLLDELIEQSVDVMKLGDSMLGPVPTEPPPTAHRQRVARRSTNETAVAPSAPAKPRSRAARAGNGVSKSVAPKTGRKRTKRSTSVAASSGMSHSEKIREGIRKSKLAKARTAAAADKHSATGHPDPIVDNDIIDFDGPAVPLDY